MYAVWIILHHSVPNLGELSFGDYADFHPSQGSTSCQIYWQLFAVKINRETHSLLR